jgi:hypothetical protein
MQGDLMRRRASLWQVDLIRVDVDLGLGRVDPKLENLTLK